MSIHGTRGSAGLVSRRVLLRAGAGLGVLSLVGCAHVQPHVNVPTPAEGVRFTTTGSTFNPSIELSPASSATVRWVGEDGSELATGTSPTIRFGSIEPQTVRMLTNFEDVVTVNLGFNVDDDAGRHHIEANYNKDSQAVDGVTGLGLLTNLRRFMAANTPLTGLLDLNGLSKLEFVECFQAQVERVDLTGCVSLVRLCMEKNRLTELDLNPVANSLRDLRAAVQQTGWLAFARLSQPLAVLYHFCVRDQTVTGHPSSEQLPACEELWNWNTGQAGDLPTPQRARSVMSRANQYTSADFAGQWTGEQGGELDLEGNKLTRVTLTGCTSLQTIRLRWNSLPTTVVDDVLAEVASWQTKGVTLLLDGNQPPTAAGLSNVAALRKIGWEVEVASP